MHSEDLCFADASRFSQTFKREFGYSPGELHSAALAGLAALRHSPKSCTVVNGEFGRASARDLAT